MPFIIGGGLAAAGLIGNIVGQGEQERDNRRAFEQADWYRQKQKERQLELVNQMGGPQFTDLAKARLEALKRESQEGPLSQDPLFQGDRSRLLQSGAQELSAIQNTQRATGTRGGFRNVGSLQDVEDRLGIAMADLGQRSREVKEQKRKEAAQIENDFANAQNDFWNAQQRARAAIEAGDFQAAMANLQAAAAAKQQANQAQNQMFGQLTGIGSSIAGQGFAQQAPRAPSYGGGYTFYDNPSASSFQQPQFGSSLRGYRYGD